MRKIPAIALTGIAAAALAGTAIAADRHTHVMNVPLPDGSVARVEYVGDVAPKVTVNRAPMPGDFWTGAIPSFPDFGRVFEQMDRQMRQVGQMARQPGGRPDMDIASYGSLPEGSSSVSVTSVSNGASTCTRTTEVVSQGNGKPPKVTSNVSGNCGSAPANPPAAVPSTGPINHT